jgi:hypothetical protein
VETEARTWHPVKAEVLEHTWLSVQAQEGCISGIRKDKRRFTQTAR